MDSVNARFTNNSIEIGSLPDFQEPDLKKVQKNLLTKHLIQIGVWFLLVIAFAVFLYFQEEILVGAVVGGILAVFLICLIFDSVKKQPLYGYALREKDIIYKRGFIVTKTTVVSFNRIQHVSISRSFIDKWLKLSTLKIFTAGGSGSDIKIPGIEPNTAEKLKEALAVKIANENA